MNVLTTGTDSGKIDWGEGYKGRTQDLLLPEHREQAYKNHLQINNNQYKHLFPVCKWFSLTNSKYKYLICSIDQENPDIAWAIIDLGGGYVEFADISINEVSDFQHPIYKIHDFERDIIWKPKKTIGGYLKKRQIR